MNRQTNLANARPAVSIPTALAALAIALGLLGSVATLFQSRGAPLQELAVAEKACADKAYPSERATCMKRRIAESRFTTVAGR
jgi:hypothetical protein